MRPPSVHATPACTATPAGCPCHVARLLHGPHRVAVRLVMILLSCQRWPPAAIAELLGYDPATVRRWIHRYNQHGVAGLEDRPGHRRATQLTMAARWLHAVQAGRLGCRWSSTLRAQAGGGV